MKLQLVVWSNMESHTTLNLMELPMELVVEILKRVPAKSVCHIRCVSKMLLSIVDSPSFVKLHSTFLLDPDSHLPPAPPQFILHYCLTDRYPSKPSLPSSFHSLHYDPSSAQGAQQLNPRLILQSSTSHYSLEFVFCNLFCIKHWKDYALSFLINPLRGEVLKLAPSPDCGSYSRSMYVSTGMGFDSITNTYKILHVTDIIIYNPSGTERRESCCVSQVLVLGTSEWRQVTSAPPPGISFSCLENVCAHGDMHWLLNYYRREGIQGLVHILSFDFKKEEFFWIPSPYILQNTSHQFDLINFRGSMAIVDTTSDTHIEIWVMKDYIKKQWMLDCSINIQVLELDLYPRFEYWKATCCEWKHGILFLLDYDGSATLTLVLDLRGPVVTKNLVKCPIEGKLLWRRIMSLNGGLISLKSYANLEEAEEPATYGDWSEGETSGKNFFYLTR